MGCTHSGGGAQVWNSTTIMALSARLPWLTALVLPQRQLETPQRKRLSHSEPPWRERAFNSVYFWTEFVVVGVCAVMGILNLCIHMFDFTISLLLSQSGAVQVFSGWRVAGALWNVVISEIGLVWHTYMWIWVPHCEYFPGRWLWFISMELYNHATWSDVAAAVAWNSMTLWEGHAGLRLAGGQRQLCKCDGVSVSVWLSVAKGVSTKCHQVISPYLTT